jgi:DNA-binding MarR family transcriptional regulator
MPHVCRDEAMVKSKRTPPPDRSPCNATAMRKASRRLSQLYDDALEPCGLRTTQFAILAEVARRSADAPTMAELARALVMDRSALGHNLRPLERDGFLAFEKGGQDARLRRVVPTPLGKKKYHEGVRLWQKAQARFHEVFGESAARRLRATLLAIAYDERLATPDT